MIKKYIALIVLKIFDYYHNKKIINFLKKKITHINILLDIEFKLYGPINKRSALFGDVKTIFLLQLFLISWNIINSSILAVQMLETFKKFFINILFALLVWNNSLNYLN